MITNTSLLWRKDVRRDLMGADWVSLKVDAVEEEDWRRVGRPHGSLKLASILEGALEFPKVCDGNLATETMLLEGVNDSAAFAFTGNVEDDLLSITAVHPMREDAVREFLAQAMADWSVVDRLIARGQIVELEYQEQRFYMRRLYKREREIDEKHRPRGACRWTQPVRFCHVDLLCLLSHAQWSER